MNCSDIQERVGPYLDGELPAADQRLLESHIESCGKCSREISELKATLALLDSVPEIDPPVDFVEQVRSRINSGEDQTNDDSAEENGSVIEMPSTTTTKKPWFNRPALQVAIAACFVGMITLVGLLNKTIKTPGQNADMAMTDAAEDKLAESGYIEEAPEDSVSPNILAKAKDNQSAENPDVAYDGDVALNLDDTEAKPTVLVESIQADYENALANEAPEKAEVSAQVASAETRNRERAKPLTQTATERSSFKSAAPAASVPAPKNAPSAPASIPAPTEEAPEALVRDQLKSLQDEPLAKKGNRLSEADEVAAGGALGGGGAPFGDASQATAPLDKARLTIKLANAAQRRELNTFIKDQNKSAASPDRQTTLRGRANKMKADKNLNAVIEIPVDQLKELIAFIDGLENAVALSLEMPGGAVITNNIPSLLTPTDSLLLESDVEPADATQ